MANRVVVGELPGGGTGIRVSRPGFNVLSTSLQGKQLAFDSRWPRTSRILISDVVTATATPGGQILWVNYGETLPYIPWAFVLWSGGNNPNWRQYPTGQFSWQGTSSTDIGQRGIQIQNNRIGFLRPTSGSSWQWSYIVLRR